MEADMNTILVPLDGSTLAEQILPYIRTLAPILSAQVRLLVVVPDPEPDRLLTDSLSGSYGVGMPPERYRERQQLALEEAWAHAEGYLAAHTSRLQAEGLDVESEVRVGPAAENIVEVAQHMRATLIAMVTHGRSGLRRWALGSVADRVVQAAPAPVLLVRGSDLPTHTFNLKRILLPLDGSDLARQALPIAVELATCARAELTLLQAIAPVIEGYPNLFSQPTSQYGAVLAALRGQAEVELGGVAGELHPQEPVVTTSVANGHPAEVIVDEAARHAASLIVMATHGRGGLRRWALGSVADKVLHTTTTPLVLVRAQ
jgi:nucleotide-binding universal stress UspA family protein